MSDKKDKPWLLPWPEQIARLKPTSVSDDGKTKYYRLSPNVTAVLTPYSASLAYSR